MAYLYAFIDESGNADFSPRGTRYLSVTSMLLDDPDVCRDALFRLRHQILDEGHDLEYFHATSDRQKDRDRVFDILAKLKPGECRVDTVLMEKAKASPAVQVPQRYYCDMIELVLKHQLAPYGKGIRNYEKLMVFLDRPSQTGAAFKAVVKALKMNLPQHLQGIPYSLHFHASKSHHGLQMADYFSWAVTVKHERAELRPLSTVDHLVRTQFDMYQGETTLYYKK